MIFGFHYEGMEEITETGDRQIKVMVLKIPINLFTLAADSNKAEDPDTTVDPNTPTDPKTTKDPKEKVCMKLCNYIPMYPHHDLYKLY